MRGILKKILFGMLVFLYAASFVMLAYTSVNAESVTEKSGNSVETDNYGDTENYEYGLSVEQIGLAIGIGGETNGFGLYCKVAFERGG